MPELAECLEHATQRLEQAQNDPRHRRKLIAAAQAWLLLANGLLRVQSQKKRTGKYGRD